MCTVCSLREPFVDGSCKVLDVLGRERGAAERREPGDAVSRGGKPRYVLVLSALLCGVGLRSRQQARTSHATDRRAVVGSAVAPLSSVCVLWGTLRRLTWITKRHKRFLSNQKRTRSKALRVCANGLCVDALHAFSDSVSLQLRPPAAARHRAPAGLALRHCSFRSWSLVLKSCPNLSFAQGSTS